MSRQGSRHEGKQKVYDPYERENVRIAKLFDETSSGELSRGSEEPETESEQDPYIDCDGDYGSDTNYIPNSGSSTTHVSDSEEEGGRVKRLENKKGTSPSTGEQMPSVESPITLQDLGVHIHVPASVDSLGDLSAILSPVSTQNAQDSIQLQTSINNLHSFDSDTRLTDHQRPRSPHIIGEEWQTSTAPVPEFEFDYTSVGPQFSSIQIHLQ
nr:uncharacterized protein LOC117995765 [Maniola hyperantus]